MVSQVELHDARRAHKAAVRQDKIVDQVTQTKLLKREYWQCRYCRAIFQNRYDETCRMMSPEIKRLATEERDVVFLGVDVDTEAGFYTFHLIKEGAKIHEVRFWQVGESTIDKLKDEQLFAIPAVTENTACHYWTLLEPQQRKLFQDVRFFRIWMPKSGKFFCVHPEWTILKEDAPIMKSK